MNMLPMITKEIALAQVPENIMRLRTDKKESKISCVEPRELKETPWHKTEE